MAVAFALFALVAALAAERAKAEDPLEVLLAGFRSVDALTADFEEEKFIALLAAPLVNRGTIAYAKPGKFIRLTTQPESSAMLVAGGAVLVGTSKKHERIAADANPMVKQFVDAYLGLVAGDRARLEAGFHVKLEGSPRAAWKLVLVPKAERMRAVFSKIVFEGQAQNVASLVIEEASGDRSVTRFSRVHLRKAFAPDESARIFRLP